MQIADPQIVRVPGATRYIPVPAEFTEPTPVPPMPSPKCLDEHGYAVLCTDQVAARLTDGDRALAECNADKAATAALPVLVLKDKQEGHKDKEPQQ